MSNSHCRLNGKHINQYLITRKSTDKLNNFVLSKVGKFNLYSHPTLEISTKTNGCFELVLIGYCFDYRNADHTTQEVINNLNINCTLSILLDQLRHLSGVYIAIWKKDDSILIIPDMCAFREVYFQKDIASSSSTLINLVNPLQEVTDSRFHQFYKSKLFQSRQIWVGYETSFKDVKRIKPNHYLDLESGLTTRFFPLQSSPPSPFKVASKKASKIVEGILKSATRRGPVMMGLTAGWDSRLLLAASRYSRKDILYFTAFHQDSKADLVVSKKMAKGLDLNYIQHQYSNTINAEDFNLASQSLPHFNVNYPGMLNTSKFFRNILSISGAASEIARMEFGVIENLTGPKLACLAKYPKHPYPEETYSQWLELNNDHFSKLGYSTLDFFYWEEILGNRTAKTISEAGTLGRAIFPAFNCLELMETLLSVDRKYRQKQNSQLYISIIKELWSEVLKYPINPGLKKRVIHYMQALGVYNKYRTIFPTGILKSIGLR
jgi:hypothetical protein